MNKYVYLFELDSVRKTDREILAGQKALYDEIARNGNTVILTYNQLIDSRAFFSLLHNDKYYNSFIQLFKKGYIRVSQFGNIRTIAQYLLDTIENDENRFIYSALPIKGSQMRLIGLMKRSLIYSDLSEINEYIHRINRTDDDLRDLFVEVEILDGKPEEKQSSLSCGIMGKVLENLYRLLETVLVLSTIHDIFILPREPDEYSHFKLKNYLAYVCSIRISSDRDPLWDKAVDILKNLACWGSDNRSLYFRELKALSLKNLTDDKAVYQYAEAIVNLCTNYAYEMSICNVSKHYNITDIECEASENSSFFKDFLTRLKQHWASGADAEIRFLQNESNVFSEFSDLTSIPDFSKITRIIPEKKEGIYEDIPRYEYKLKSQQWSHKLKILKNLPRQIAPLMIVAFLAMLLNILLEAVHNIYSGSFTSLISWRAFLSFSLETMVFITIGEFLTAKISNKFPWLLSFSEAVHTIVCIWGDARYILIGKTNTYVSEHETDVIEKRSTISPISFCESKELKKYVSFYAQNPDLVAVAPEYPIADVRNKSELDRIVRNSELYRRKYGVVYNSSFNTMIVDPIEDGKGGYYAYERLIPSVKNYGVVLFTICKDKIVLIRQFRHAIRKEQLCCPRGFGENGIDVSENAKKELYEELNAKVTEEPVKLGEIIADSGISSAKAIVYLMKIDTYSYIKEEGIRDIIEVSPDEFRILLLKGDIDDGHTLAAYSLYSAYISSGNTIIQ